MPPRHGPNEIKVHGRHACRAVAERRPTEIVRAYVGHAEAQEFRDLLTALARDRKPYKVVDDSELEAITESKHHEGICIVVRERPVPSLAEVIAAPGPAVIVALADVGNPHNVGAILRTAAHFGARALLVSGATRRLAPAAHRTAQGGAEWVDVLFGGDLADALPLCRNAGFVVCATTSHDGRGLYDGPLPERVLLMLGSEGEGLAPELMEEAEVVVKIPGTGHVESLNVGSAAAVILAEWWRQRGGGRSGGPSPRTSPARAGEGEQPARARRRPQSGRP